MLARLVCVGQSGISVRRVGGNRAGEMRFTRFLRNRRVTPDEMVATAREAEPHEQCVPRRSLGTRILLRHPSDSWSESATFYFIYFFSTATTSSCFFLAARSSAVSRKRLSNSLQ